MVCCLTVISVCVCVCGGANPLCLLPPAHQEVIKVIQPVLLGKMILYFENYDPKNMTALYETLGYAAGMSACTIALALLHHLYFYHVQRAGMKIRVAMCHMIYKKVSKRGGHLSAQSPSNAALATYRGRRSCILVFGTGCQVVSRNPKWLAGSCLLMWAHSRARPLQILNVYSIQQQA